MSNERPVGGGAGQRAGEFRRPARLRHAEGEAARNRLPSADAAGAGVEAGPDGLEYRFAPCVERPRERLRGNLGVEIRSEEHTSELQSLMRISYAVFCLKKPKNNSHYSTTLLTTPS